MQQSLGLIAAQNKEDTKKQRLQKVIQKKRAQLQELVTKTEMLKVNLEMAKQEYMVRVGGLYIKDNQLDLEIIRLKNIHHLMNEGYTYDEAVDKIANSYYSRQIEEDLKREQEEFDQARQNHQKQEEHASQPLGDITKLWKKLIVKFHPDLIQDPTEKKKRDTIMKQINRAYQERDYDQLLKIDHENMVVQEMTIDNLSEILIRLTNDITNQKKFYADLKESEWYDWMLKIEKAKKKSLNIFAETERRLLNDIVAKLDIIKKLKSQIQNFTTA
jgi:hypothetical protein